MTESTNPRFTVDTKLFRELGELLVGRDSTALAELIKNAYDADATLVTVEGTNLRDADQGQITIVDNGVGMNRGDFENGFLRIASRSRVTRTRRSPVYHRRYTGSKGVGRLAAHKLARILEIQSWKWDGSGKRPLASGRPGLEATINWDIVERQQTLDDIPGSGALGMGSLTAAEFAGTIIKLTSLRRHWSASQLAHFHNEVRTMVPLDTLLVPSPDVFGTKLLFDRPNLRDAASGEDPFRLHLRGDLEPADTLLPDEVRTAISLIEIECDANADIVRLGIALRPKTDDTVEPRRRVFKISQSKLMKRLGIDAQLSFRARIYESAKRAWSRDVQGVRVYMEGFRVAPYGDVTDDWLALKKDSGSARASRELPGLAVLTDIAPPSFEKEGIFVKGDQMYLGAVFLTEESAPGLQMLINREGFLPSPTLTAIGKIVRMGIDLATRLRLSTEQSSERPRASQASSLARAVDEGNPRQLPSAEIWQQHLQTLTGGLREVRETLAVGKYNLARSQLAKLDTPAEEVSRFLREETSERAMFRVLASLGTQLAAFHHEIGNLLAAAEGLVERLDRLAATGGFSADQTRLLNRARESAQGIRNALDRQAIYLIDVTSIDARRRRSRQGVKERLESAIRVLADAAKRRNIKIQVDVDPNIRTPPMFPAEVTMIMTNLLSNAIKAAGQRGVVRCTAEIDKGTVVFRMENTGKKVSVSTSEKWFRPFESTTVSVDAVLGQGMGLGLTITRSMLDEYGATIRFVEASPNFQTAVEVRFGK